MAADPGYFNLLSSDQIEDIIVNLSQQKPDYTEQELISAINHYDDNDAFLVLKWISGTRKLPCPSQSREALFTEKLLAEVHYIVRRSVLQVDHGFIGNAHQSAKEADFDVGVFSFLQLLAHNVFCWVDT